MNQRNIAQKVALLSSDIQYISLSQVSQ